MAIQKLTIAALSGSSGASSNSAATLTVDEYNNIQSNISWILGTGEGNYGYGQTVLTDENAPLAPNTSLTNTLYNLLADDIKKSKNSPNRISFSCYYTRISCQSVNIIRLC